MKVVTFRCPDFVLEELDLMAKMYGVPRSILIRFAVTKLLEGSVRFKSEGETIRVRRICLRKG